MENGVRALVHENQFLRLTGAVNELEAELFLRRAIDALQIFDNVPGQAPLGGYLLDRCARSFSFSLQTVSSTSLSGSSTSVAFTVNGFVYITGSSIVTVRSMWPKSRR